MELHIIRHKTAEDYFRDFCPEGEVRQYSYQLQRMFESGAAKEGDYFLVRNEERSFLRAEIYRNNTRRIWEKEPESITSQDKNADKSVAEALDLIFRFLDDEMYYAGCYDKLEIVIDEESEHSETMRSLCTKHNYSEFEIICEFGIPVHENEGSEYEETGLFRKFTVFDPEFRFDLVCSSDPVCKLFGCSVPERIYQDYLDDSYLSEDMWKVIMNDKSVTGFFMPSFTSGLKTNLRLMNYSLPEKPEPALFTGIIADMKKIAAINGSQLIEIPVRSSDSEFMKKIESEGGALIRKFGRYAKSDPAR